MKLIYIIKRLEIVVSQSWINESFTSYLTNIIRSQLVIVYVLMSQGAHQSMFK